MRIQTGGQMDCTSCFRRTRLASKRDKPFGATAVAQAQLTQASRNARAAPGILQEAAYSAQLAYLVVEQLQPLGWLLSLEQKVHYATNTCARELAMTQIHAIKGPDSRSEAFQVRASVTLAPTLQIRISTQHTWQVHLPPRRGLRQWGRAIRPIPAALPTVSVPPTGTTIPRCLLSHSMACATRGCKQAASLDSLALWW